MNIQIAGSSTLIKIHLIVMIIFRFFLLRALNRFPLSFFLSTQYSILIPNTLNIMCIQDPGVGWGLSLSLVLNPSIRSLACCRDSILSGIQQFVVTEDSTARAPVY